jgi:hypothetical protein
MVMSYMPRVATLSDPGVIPARAEKVVGTASVSNLRDDLSGYRSINT